MSEGGEPKRVVIRAGMQAEPEKPIDHPRDPRRRRPPLGPPIAVAGGTLECLCPLLPWWSRSTVRLGITESSVGGLGGWPGFVCLAAGATVLLVVACRYAKPESGARTAGTIVLLAGFLGAVAAILGMASPSSFAGYPGLSIHVMPAAYLASIGGLLAAAGGYIQLKEIERA